jgi:hypothetical protein
MTRSKRGVARNVVNLTALALVLGALAYSLVFRLGGGHWERVETPSMGTTAPVGTLLWVEPADTDDLAVGDVVSFHKPGSTEGTVYSHRIAEVHDDGTFGTAGDLSGPDAWVVQPTDVVGRVVHIWPGAGWLVLAAPVLVLGGLVTGTLVLLVRRTARLPLALIGASVTLAAVLVVYEPLAGAELLGVDQGDGQATASYVSTGLLPIRVTAPGGSTTDITPGEAGSVTMHATGGTLKVDVHSHVPTWFWVLLVSVCFSPAVGSAVVGRREQGGRPLVAAPAT